MKCPACNQPCEDVFFRSPELPASCNVLHRTRPEALLAPRGRIELACCGDCGLIWNVAFDASRMRYAAGYENALHFSGRYRQYSRSQARRLVDRHGLAGGRAVEIGCGDGYYLSLLREMGMGQAVGFDPSARGGRGAAPGVRIVPRHFRPSDARKPMDLLCCRQVLEHLPQPGRFLRDLRAAMDGHRDTVLFFEVPNACWTLEHKGIWDIIYEHFTYFTPQSLRRLFHRCGFAVVSARPAYGGQFITLTARPGAEHPAPGGPADGRHHRLIRSFDATYRRQVRLWRQRLAEFSRARKRLVLWGAGSKGVTFLNTMNVSPTVAPFVVDVNPRKHGCYVAGAGQRVIAPDALREYRPEVVILTNPVYRREVAESLRRLGVDARLLQT
ncbi:MAG: class I SAM-dependent methyltransferase [Phycisphaerae bacterium]